MTLWVVIAVTGGVLSLAGLAILVRQYHRGEITRRHLLAVVVGYIFLVSYALLSVLGPRTESGVLSVLVLLPGFVAIIVLVGERQRARDESRSRR